MAEIHVNPTRMEMKKLQTRYQTARKGHKLLKDKCDELMKRFLDVVREDKDVRARVEDKLAAFYNGFAVAAAVTGPALMAEALACPGKEETVVVDTKNVMSVIVPTFALKVTQKNAGMSYGTAFTSGELDASLAALNDVMEDMIHMAELEKTAQLLAEEIERTRRRVNALEHIMMPRYLAAIKVIRMKLDENERSNTTRLMKVKDMMLAEARKTPNDGEE